MNESNVNESLVLMNKSFFDYVFVEKLAVNSSTEVLDKLSTMLYLNGAVLSQFRIAVIEREQNFPTGMRQKFRPRCPIRILNIA